MRIHHLAFLLFILLTLTAGRIGLSETIITAVDLPSNWIIHDPSSGALFATVPSSALAPYGNHIVSLDPSSAQVGQEVFAGSEPARMALSSDGARIFIALNGNNRMVTFDMATRSITDFFEVGEVDDRVEDMEPVPGHPDAIVVSVNPGPGGSRNRGLVVFVDGNPLPKTLGGPINVITFSENETILYGHTSGISPHNNLMTLALDLSPDGGLERTLTTDGVFSAFQDDMQYAGGNIYGQRGEVIIAETHQPIGRFNVPFGTHPFVADAQLGHTFFVHEDDILVFDQATFLQKGAINVPGMEDAKQLIRWGSNGLAVRCLQQIYLVKSDLIGPAVMPEAPFKRGDINVDDVVNLADAIGILEYLFINNADAPGCLKTADANDSGGINLADAVYLLSYLYSNAPPPEPPFLACGTDPTDDNLSCDSFTLCE